MKKLLVALLFLNIPISVYAADTVYLKFTGNIKAATCNLSTGNNLDVDLTTIPLDTFYSGTKASDWKIFTIELKDCSSFINSVRLTFSGTADNADVASLYKNSGTATNIAIQLQSGDGATPLGNSKVLTIPTNGQPLVSVPLRTRAFSSLGNGTSGTLSANITATITYL
ncbi:fimbrial protein [Providencia alcalifaciens]|uniref:fimbrial protein n=1 Tax=Providencia alcalifaciens TaxID=126385 RepID=UPI0012B67C2E|nr:fimbrial protein [Providencia alcalifaciens]MTC52327.1 fimbrial protein [Providencia alcalifaciens]